MLTKLSGPTLPRVLDRPRLFGLLDDARRRPVVWIAAPPGTGKTTLAASYLRARRMRAFWYHIDLGDADPATLFHYLGLAVRGAKRNHPQLPHLTPEFLPGLQTFARRFFEDYFALLPKRAIVVFDNYHLLPESSPIHEILGVGLREMPQRMNAIVLSRRDPPGVFAPLKATRALSELAHDALFFSAAESKGLIRLFAPRRARLDGADAARLHRQTHGWAAGLVLLLEQEIGAPRRPRPHAATTLALTRVFDYLAHEVLQHCAPATQIFLLKTACVSALTVDMARELTGMSGAADILAELYRTRFLTERYDDEAATYRYHALFREFLEAQARLRFGAEELLSLKEHAARLLERAGRIEEAGALFAEAKQFSELARLALSHASSLLSQGRAAVVESWLDCLPPAMLEDMPWLLIWRASCRLPVDPVDAQRGFERAFDGLHALGDRAGTLLAWSGVVDSIWYAWRNVGELDRWIDRFSALAPEEQDPLPPEIEAVVTCAMFNALFWRRPTPAVIAPWATKVTRILHTADVLAPQLGATAVSLINYYTLIGDIAGAEQVLHRLREGVGDRSPAPILALASWQGDAVLGAVLADAGRCTRAVAAGLDLAARTGVAIWNASLYGAGCLGALLVGDVAEAERFLARILADSKERALHMRPWALQLQAAVACERGDFSEARQAAEESIRSTAREGIFPEGLGCLALAHIAHAEGRRRDAARHLARLETITRDIASPLFELGGGLAAAQFAFDRGDRARGLTALRAAMAAGAKTGLMDCQGKVRHSDLSRLCAHALDAGIETDYVRRMILKRRLKPDSGGAVLDAWPWAVKVYTLGRFAVVIDQRPIPFVGKVQRRPLELLKVLIAAGGRAVPEARIIDSLWPDAEGDAAHSSLTMALKRLRALLRQPEAVLLAENKLTLNPDVCWVDVWAFERRLGEAKPDLEAVAKTLELYRGPFLGGDDDVTWAVPLRERLRERFIERTTSVGRKLERRSAWREAIRWYRRASHVDDLAEELYQRLMICHDRLGQRGEAASAYRRCVRALETRLGLAVSKRTEEIYRSVSSEHVS